MAPGKQRKQTQTLCKGICNKSRSGITAYQQIADLDPPRQWDGHRIQNRHIQHIIYGYQNKEEEVVMTMAIWNLEQCEEIKANTVSEN